MKTYHYVVYLDVNFECKAKDVKELDNYVESIKQDLEEKFIDISLMVDYNGWDRLEPLDPNNPNDN